MFGKYTPVVTIAITTALVFNVIVFIILTSSPNGKSGIKCWDKNRNDMCDIRTEDINKDGVCDFFDCFGRPSIDGVNGPNGTYCWDKNQNFQCDLELEDYNNDGFCDFDDCYNLFDGLKCFNETTYPSGNISLCKGDDFVVTTVPSLFCWDSNQNSIQDFPFEDVNSDGFIDARDCDARDAYKCWDADLDYECDAEEDIDSELPCNTTDCIGERGDHGDACWDLNGNGECDVGEDINEDGVCNANDCLTYECWDTNQNSVCDLLTEDIDLSGECDRDDCIFTNITASRFADPDTLAQRGEGQEATYAAELDANVVYVTGELVYNPSEFGFPLIIPYDAIYGESIVQIDNGTYVQFTAIGDIYFDGNVNIALSLIPYIGEIKPRTSNNITFTADNFLSPNQVRFDSINTGGFPLQVNTGSGSFNTLNTLIVNNITHENLTFAKKLSVDTNLEVEASKTVKTDFIDSYFNGYIECKLDGITTFSLVYTDDLSSYLYVEGEPLDDLWFGDNTYTNGTLFIANTVYPRSNLYNYIGEVNVRSIRGNPSDLVISSDTAIYINASRFDVAILTSSSGDLQLPSTAIEDVLETDTLDSYTLGGSTTFSNGIYLSNSEPSYNPYKLDFYEVLDIATTMSGIWSVPVPINLRVERLGIRVALSCKQTSRFTATTSAVINIDTSLPARFSPPTTFFGTGINVFNNNTASYIGMILVAGNGLMYVYASHVVADRPFTALNHQNGVGVFSVEYLL